MHTQNVDPALKGNHLLANRDARVNRVLSNSFGFGGSNCSLILATAG
jgi:3-oxoacyl-[acyl-carrier-protein] synthase-1